MRFDKYTQKAQAAILDAQSLAEQSGHATIDPEHLLLALMRQKGGVVPSIVSRIGVDQALVVQSVEQLLAAKSQTSTAQTIAIIGAALGLMGTGLGVYGLMKKK